MHSFFHGKRVFVTGHTGFKGSWLCMMLKSFGANVTGYSLPALELSHFNLINLQKEINHIEGDILDLNKLQKAMQEASPEIIFHLAAQPFVRRSYRNPIETWQTNVIGTLNVLEATKSLKNLKAIVNITTDKCYHNKEWVYSYRETDELGGHDPYSASKAAVEILSQSYRASFLKQRGIQMATVRAGNVIGGGDFGEDRLLPAFVYAIQKNEAVIIRKPNATRPWQHVLEALHGYCLLAEKLCNNNGFDIAYNFGPQNCMPVIDVLKNVQKIVPSLKYKIDADAETVHEAGLLMLDNSLAKEKLNWKPTLNTVEAINLTFQWYLEYINDTKNLKNITEKQIKQFINLQ
jgi:CDP-glucose 4,6-dehydratase